MNQTVTNKQLVLIKLVTSEICTFYNVIDDVTNKAKVPGKYAGYTLDDCVRLVRFYNLIIARKFKKAYQQLSYLWKESGLVPDAIAQSLTEIIEI